jgi:hypothetical protein
VKRAVIGAAAACLAIIAAFFLLRAQSATDGVQSRPVVTVNLVIPSKHVVAAGTPVAFEVSLSGLADAPPISVGNRWSPWPDLIDVTIRGSDEATRIEVVRSGTPSGIHLRRDDRNGWAIERLNGGRARIHGREYVHTMRLTIPPEVSARLAAGRYSIAATLATRWWDIGGWRGRIESAPVTFEVVAESPAHVRERLASTAAYWLQASDAAKAERAARELLSAHPTDIHGHMLLGDALAHQGRKMDALDAYSVALGLAESVGGREPPVHIFNRMGALFGKNARR